MTALVRQINPKKQPASPTSCSLTPSLTSQVSPRSPPASYIISLPLLLQDPPLPCGSFLRPSEPPLSILAPSQLSPDSLAALSLRMLPTLPNQGPRCSVSLSDSSGHRPESGSGPPHSLPGDLRWVPSSASLATSLPCPAPIRGFGSPRRLQTLQGRGCPLSPK